MHEIQLEKVGEWNLFEFSESLQLQMECFSEQKKADQMAPDEIIELETIGKLDWIFTQYQCDACCSKCRLVMKLSKL
jgi:hypothetical protein